MKIEHGKAFGHESYLVVPDKSKPSTWKLRVRDLQGHISKAQLGRAHAALGKGFRGRRVHITQGQRRVARRRLEQMEKQIMKQNPSDFNTYYDRISDIMDRTASSNSRSAVLASVKQAEQVLRRAKSDVSEDEYNSLDYYLSSRKYDRWDVLHKNPLTSGQIPFSLVQDLTTHNPRTSSNITIMLSVLALAALFLIGRNR
mgnify:CR=1 FL=1